MQTKIATTSALLLLCWLLHLSPLYGQCELGTEPPIIVYPAQDIAAEIDACDIGGTAEVSFEISAVDNCGDAVTPTVLINGTAIQAIEDNTYTPELTSGAYLVTIEATDAVGNTRMEDFFIGVFQAPPPTSTLACLDTIHITLSSACEATIIPEMLLSGAWGCKTPEDFQLSNAELDRGSDLLINAAGIYPIHLSPVMGNAGPGNPDCTTYVVAEDKEAPVVICRDEITQVRITKSVQFLNDSLTANAPELDFTAYTCFQEGPNNNLDTSKYDLISFSVTEADVYTFELNANFPEAAAALFQGEFNVDFPCQNIIAQSNTLITGGGVFPDSSIVFRIQLPLEPGVPYTILTTTDFPDTLGNYQWAIQSDEGGSLIGTPTTPTAVVRDLFCIDLQQILDEEVDLPVLSTIEASDNCTTNLDIHFTDNLLTGGDCAPDQLIRTFVAEDESGNQSQCEQAIIFRKPTIADVTLPPYTVFIECDEEFPLDTLGNPSPTVTGFPFVSTAFGKYDLDDVFCTLGASYSDEPRANICENAYLIRREWTLFDWCNPIDLATYDQVLKIGDFTGPTIECTADTLSFSTGPFDCSAALEVPLPTVSDDCSSWTLLTEVVSGENAQILATIPHDAPDRIVSDIPIGCHQFRYTAFDHCGNKTVATCDFCVVDEVEPSAVCVDLLNVSLGGDGFGIVYAESVDEGSTDNCGIAKLEVRRQFNTTDDCTPVPAYFSIWADSVKFTCCDLRTDIVVELRVTDYAGNENTCWFEANVEDKIKPTCTAPSDTVLTCTDFPSDFSPTDVSKLQNLFGYGAAEDNCTANIVELEPIVNIDNCGFGTILRRFEAVDSRANRSEEICEQLIQIEESSNYEIKFPKDVSTDCGAIYADTLEYQEFGCDLLAVSQEDEFFSAAGESCFKILRTFSVLNWCEYDGVSDPVVIDRDEDCDGIPGDEDYYVLRRPDAAFIDRDTNETNGSPISGEKGIACDGFTNPLGHWKAVTSVGYWEYTQVIKVSDNEAATIFYDSPEPFCGVNHETCLAPVSYVFFAHEACSPEAVEVKAYYDRDRNGTMDEALHETGELTGDYPKYRIDGDFDFGTHDFLIQIDDGCGNRLDTIMPFEVIDCSAPTPICIDGLALDLMPVAPDTDVDGDGDFDTGANVVYVTDFIASPSGPDCFEPVRYSINKAGEQPNIEQDYLIVTCDDIGILDVEVYAWDSYFNPIAVQPDSTIGGPNRDFCLTTLEVQDNLFSNCSPGGDSPSIAGGIYLEEGRPVPGVEVRLNNSAPIITGDDGTFLFESLELGYDYTVIPQKESIDINGVSTFDLVMISKHILGIESLSSPYKIIAADVNNSMTVSTLDLIHLRKLILGVVPELPNQNGWKFVVADFEFPDPERPFSSFIPGVVNVNNIDIEQVYAEFIAIKIGDVNGSVQLDAQELEERMEREPVEVVMDNPILAAGDCQWISFDLQEVEQVEGLQFTLSFDSEMVKVKDFAPGFIGENNIGWHKEGQGQLLFSWNKASAEESTQAFQLQVCAQQMGVLRTAIEITSETLRAEAYQDEGAGLEIHPVQLTTTKPKTTAFALSQNYPNPFQDYTTVWVQLPTTAKGHLSIRNSLGQLIHQQSGYFESGQHEIVLTRDLLEPGLLFYTFETEHFQETRSMLLLE